MIQSIALVLALGLLMNRIFTWLKLPGLLGMILVGIAIGPYGLDWLHPSVMENATEIRMIALIIILLRAGLGLEKSLLKSVGSLALKMSAIPCLLEGFAIMAVARYLLNLPWLEAGMLGFIIAAVSPAVIVPAMLQLKEQGLGMRRGIPIIVLAGASIDDVFAITLFTVFLGMATQAGASPVAQIAWIPVQIIGGILLGGVAGWLLAYLSPCVKVSHLEGVGVTIAGAFAILVVGEQLGVASLLGVMAMGFVLLEKAAHRSERLNASLDTAWFFAQIFLFVLIGAEVDLGLAWQAGLAGLVVIATGLTARTLGVMLALAGSSLTRGERLFTAIAYLPKATVQAAIGGIPLAAGVASGGTMLAIAVLAVVITASLGAIGIKVAAPRLLEVDGAGAVPEG